MLHLLSELAVTPSNTVWCATRSEDDTIVAVKLTSRSTIKANEGIGQRLLRERGAHELLSAQTHPNIVQYIGFYHDANVFGHTMEYVDGGDLFTKLMDHGPMDEASMRRPALEICSALGHMHSLDFVHLDLKTENILITTEGQCKLADFGSCIRLRRPVAGDGSPLPVRLDAFIGTPETMSPEAIADQLVTEEADWWSYGCVLFEMLTGDSPFYNARDTTLVSLVVRIIRGNFEFPNAPVFSGAIVDLIESLLVRNPSLRLGARPHGHSAIASHAWFEGLTWPAALDTAPQETGADSDKDNEAGAPLQGSPYVFAGVQMPKGTELMDSLVAYSELATVVGGLARPLAD